jgi:glycosyltransferase involved in cell wall biosynthesis
VSATPRTAALLYHPDGYITKGVPVVGRRVAGEEFLRALVRHGGLGKIAGLVSERAHAEAFVKHIAEIDPALQAEAATFEAPARFAGTSIFLPGPGLGGHAWWRRRHRQSAFSLVGVTHTTATERTMDSIGDLLVSPVQPWDALICTSRAVQGMVRRLIAEQAHYLRDRLGATRFEGPHLPIIPLGVDCDAFAMPEGARAKWRERLEIPEEAVAVLVVGRLSPSTKFTPGPLYLALEQAARAAKRPVHLILAGYFEAERHRRIFLEGAAALCPSVPVRHIDATEDEARREIWAAGDIFTLPVDNVQETFGLAPIEAMAAGMPVVVTDWDGFRDTVRDGVTGFRIPVLAASQGQDIALRFAAGMDNYSDYLVATAQHTAMDVAAAAEAFRVLIADPVKRRTMGDAARAHARLAYDWPAVIAQYAALFDELAQHRAAAGGERAPTQAGREAVPLRPDPYAAFADYPTRRLTRGMRFALAPGAGAERFAELTAVPGVIGRGMLLPDVAAFRALFARLSEGPATLEEIAALGAQGQGWRLSRAMVWLLKYDLVREAR